MAALPAKTTRASANSSPPSSLTTMPSLVRWLKMAPLIVPSASERAEPGGARVEEQRDGDQLDHP